MINNDNEPKNIRRTFECKLCNFKCSKISNHTVHMRTRKHLANVKMMTHNDGLMPLGCEKMPKTYQCICGNTYAHRQGLSVHKKKCTYTADTLEVKIVSEYDSSDQLTDAEIIKLVLKQNRDLNEKMTELIKNGCNNTTTTTNNYNKTFNLNIFLNQECKDAMNIMDFVESLKLQLSDLENVGKYGYVNGISDIIVKNLQALAINKRPVHCSDIKREVLYIKDEDQWEKDDGEKHKLRKAIKHIAHKNSKMLNEFKEKYPDCLQSESKKSGQYVKLLIESMGGSGNDDAVNENKIIRNIAKEVVIEKGVNLIV
jgi:hypothetical protein